jgi:hypothetical protein
MNVKVSRNELWPIYMITDDFGVDVDLSADEYAFITAAFEQYGRAQNILWEAYRKAGGE